MTSTSATPPLLPGRSASAWVRAFSVLGWFYIPVGVLFVASEFLHWSRGNIFIWLVPLICLFVISILFGWFYSRSNRRELAAGYTTVWGSNPTVPQLDPSTGEVIRQAGQPYVKRKEWSKGVRETVRPPLHPTAEPTFFQRLLSSWSSLIWIVIVCVGGLIAISLAHIFPLGPSFAIGGGLLALSVIAYAIPARITSVRLKLVNADAPGDFAFVFSAYGSRIETVSIGLDLKAGDGKFPNAVSANKSGLTFWDVGTGSVGSLPWSRVVSLQPDRVSVGNTSRPGIQLSYRNTEDKLDSLVLVNVNSHAVAFLSMTEANWIAGELESLRAGESTAKVL